MRALSFTQPWLFAILECGKRIENRGRVDGRMPSMCRYRGPLLLHAAMGIGSQRAYNKVCVAIWTTARRAPPDATAIDRGAIVGRCNVVGSVAPARTAGGAVILDYRGDLDLRWWAGGYALVLADVEPLPPVPCKGALGLWKPSPGILAAYGLLDEREPVTDASGCDV